MNRLSILICAAAAATLMASCAKENVTHTNDAGKRFLEAWMKINHPDAVKSGLGIYILEENAGSGKEAGSVKDYPYAYVSYTATDLDGNISESTDASVAEQLGTYDPTKNPTVFNVEADKVKQWIANGAQPTDTVKALLKKNGVIE